MPTKSATKKPTAAPKPTIASKGYKPRWDLYGKGPNDGLTQGAINTFLDCREQFRLRYVLGYRSKVKSGTTAFGSAFHDVLALTQHSKTGKVLSLDEAVKHHYESLGGVKLAPAQQEQVSLMLGTVRCLIERYGKRWEKEDAPKKWIAREETFDELYTVDRPACSIRVRGRFDGVFETKNGDLWLHETKTKSRIDEDGIASMLPHDVQTQLYCWAIRKKFGKYPKGVVYDIIRKPELRQKKESKSTPAETNLDFLQRIGATVDSEMDWYFMRWNVSLLKSDMDTWENKFLKKVLRQLVEWWESIKTHPNQPWDSPLHFMRPGAFWTQYGRSDYFDALTKNEFFALEQTDVIYPELVD